MIRVDYYESLYIFRHDRLYHPESPFSTFKLLPKRLNVNVGYHLKPDQPPQDGGFRTELNSTEFYHFLAVL